MAHLYLDTALSALTMHLVRTDGAVFSFAATEHRASDSLHAELKTLMDDAGVTPQDLSHLTLVRGPGSFTGVRIAYTLAEALKLSLPKLVISAVNTLEAFAYSQIDLLPENEEITVATNAHGGKIFTQKIQREKDHENNKIILKSDVSCVEASEVTSGHILADPSLAWAHAGTPASPLLTPTGMAQAIQHHDYAPLYIKPLTYRKLGEK